jgi:hypothetical protein
MNSNDNKSYDIDYDQELFSEIHACDRANPYEKILLFRCECKIGTD